MARRHPLERALRTSATLIDKRDYRRARTLLLGAFPELSVLRPQALRVPGNANWTPVRLTRAAVQLAIAVVRGDGLVARGRRFAGLIRNRRLDWATAVLARMRDHRLGRKAYAEALARCGRKNAALRQLRQLRRHR